MRQYFFASLLLIAFNAYGQIEFGVKAGLNSIDLISKGISIENGIKNLQINFKESSYGYHAGFYSRISVPFVYIEPALIFNSNKVDYILTEYNEGEIVNSIVSESYKNLDIPVMIGFKAGVLRFFGGPVGHLHLNNTSELIDISGYKEKFQHLKYGYQAGFGIDIWKLRIELAYENNLDKFGDHIVIDGQQYSFDNGAARLLGTIGLRF